MVVYFVLIHGAVVNQTGGVQMFFSYLGINVFQESFSKQTGHIVQNHVRVYNYVK